MVGQKRSWEDIVVQLLNKSLHSPFGRLSTVFVRFLRSLS